MPNNLAPLFSLYARFASAHIKKKAPFAIEEKKIMVRNYKMD
jgi:hypothetical protein